MYGVLARHHTGWSLSEIKQIAVRERAYWLEEASWVAKETSGNGA